MQIDPFGVEIWMNAQETRCTLNLAETCVHSLTIAELLTLAGKNDQALSDLLPMQMTYGAIEGSTRLRNAIAALYKGQTAANVVVTHGTIGANALVHQAMVSQGDRVVSIVPTYQQHTAIPASIGAEVVELRLRAEDGYLPDLAELRRLAVPGTRLITLTNPNNPTGALIGPAMQAEIVTIARAAGAWLLADEVYRGTEQSGVMTPSFADLYEKAISTAGMSKAFSLAGLRLGWVVAPQEVLEAVLRHRDYNTISVGMIDDHFAAMALEHSDRILGRSRMIVQRNLKVLSDWVAATPGVSFIRPEAGTVALLNYGLAMPSREFCERLMADTGVLFVPGEVFGEEGKVRIGYACATEVLENGLAQVGNWLAGQRG